MSQMWQLFCIPIGLLILMLGIEVLGGLSD